MRSLQNDNGLTDPLVNCLQLQRLLRGIKRVQGSSPPKCLPVTIDLLKDIQRYLDLNSRDHIMIWAACCLGFFGFLRAGEFTTNSPFDRKIHLTLSDVQANSLVDPTCFRITSSARVGCDIYVGRGNSLICPVVALANFLALRGPSPGPLFCYANGRPFTWQQLSSTVKAILHSAGYHGSYWVIASGLVQPQQLRHGEFLITSLRHLADGPVTRINSIFAHRLDLLPRSPVSWHSMWGLCVSSLGVG